MRAESWIISLHILGSILQAKQFMATTKSKAMQARVPQKQILKMPKIISIENLKKAFMVCHGGQRSYDFLFYTGLLLLSIFFLRFFFFFFFLFFFFFFFFFFLFFFFFFLLLFPLLLLLLLLKTSVSSTEIRQKFPQLLPEISPYLFFLFL